MVAVADSMKPPIFSAAPRCISLVICVYVSSVNPALKWPSILDRVFTSTPLEIAIVANVCHYGIITTNGKSLDFQGVSAFVAVYSIPFPKLKYGEKIDEKRRLLH